MTSSASEQALKKTSLTTASSHHGLFVWLSSSLPADYLCFFPLCIDEQVATDTGYEDIASDCEEIVISETW